VLKRYRELNLSARLLGLVVLEALIAAVAFRNYGLESVPIAVGISAGVLIALDTIVRRSALVIAAAIGVGQLLLASLIGVFIEGYLYYTYSVDARGLYYLLVVTGFIFLLFVQIGLAYYVARGRVWLNLLVSSLLVDVGFVLAVNLLRVDFTSALLIDLGLVLLYFLLRSVRFRRQQKPEVPTRTAGALRKAERFFTDRGYTTLQAGESYPWLDTVAENGKSIYATLVLDPHNSLAFGGNVLSQDAKDITYVFEYALRDMRRWARNHRVPLERIQFLLFTHKSSLQPGYRALRVRARHTPDRVLGTIALVNHTGLEKLMKSHGRDAAFSKRLGARLARLQDR
jgi:hypothetical protein